MLVRRLDNSIFHLDGIQWVPGAVQSLMSEWIDVCLRVLKSGKCLVIECKPEEVGFILSRPSYKGLMLCIPCRSEREAKSVMRIINHFIIKE